MPQADTLSPPTKLQPCMGLAHPMEGAGSPCYMGAIIQASPAPGCYSDDSFWCRKNKGPVRVSSCAPTPKYICAHAQASTLLKSSHPHQFPFGSAVQSLGDVLARHGQKERLQKAVGSGTKALKQWTGFPAARNQRMHVQEPSGIKD